MVSVEQPINNWYNGQPFLSSNWIDNGSVLAINDARYLKKTITDTTTSSQLNLNSGILALGSATTTSSNTINGVNITLASASSSGNVLINRPIDVGYAPSSTLYTLMGYTLNTGVGTPITFVSTEYKIIRSQNLAAGNWVLALQFNLTALTGGTITKLSYGASTNNGSIVAFTNTSVAQLHTSKTYTTGDIEKYQICFPFQITSTQNIYLFWQSTFATGTYNAVVGSTLMRVA
jgi:hypothetical protein